MECVIGLVTSIAMFLFTDAGSPSGTLNMGRWECSMWSHVSGWFAGNSGGESFSLSGGIVPGISAAELVLCRHHPGGLVGVGLAGIGNRHGKEIPSFHVFFPIFPVPSEEVRFVKVLCLSIFILSLPGYS